MIIIIHSNSNSIKQWYFRHVVSPPNIHFWLTYIKYIILLYIIIQKHPKTNVLGCNKHLWNVVRRPELWNWLSLWELFTRLTRLAGPVNTEFFSSRVAFMMPTRKVIWPHNTTAICIKYNRLPLFSKTIHFKHIYN